MSKELREMIKQLGASGSTKYYTGQVSEINEENRTIAVVIEEGLEVDNVRLTSTIDSLDSFFVHYPETGSDVLITESEGAWFMLLCSKVAKSHYKSKDFELIIDAGKLSITASEISINKGENKGLVNIEPLKEVLGGITAWMQKIDFVLKNTQVLTTAPGSPDALQVALKAAIIATQVPNVRQYDLENTKVKH